MCACVRARCDGAAQPDTGRHRLRASDTAKDGSGDSSAPAMLTFTLSTGYCDIQNPTEATDELATGSNAKRRVTHYDRSYAARAVRPGASQSAAE